MYISLTNKFQSLSATQMLLIKTALISRFETVIVIDERREEAFKLDSTNGTDVQTLPYSYDAALEAHFQVGKTDGFKELTASGITVIIAPTEALDAS